MREVGIVAFILTLVWANTELTIAPTPNCNTENQTTQNWIEARDKVVKNAYDDG